MTPKINKLYNSGVKNKEFLNAIKEADGDGKPNILSENIEKHFFSSIYYGWLVAKYGVNWKKHL